jgi:hypothetical protein
MEDVLEDQRPYDPKRPQVCMDETSKQLLADTRDPIPGEPGLSERFDHEYKREGVANLFTFSEPLIGKRHVKVTERRTRKDWALTMKELADEYYPEAEVIVMVLDNLNTHMPASFTKRLTRKRPAVWSIGLSFITRPNKAVGSIWQNMKLINSAWICSQVIRGSKPALVNRAFVWLCLSILKNVKSAKLLIQ